MSNSNAPKSTPSNRIGGTWLLLVAAMTTLPSFFGCEGDGQDTKKPKMAFITNGVASFWVIAEAGCKQGAEEAGVDVEVLMPAEGITSQKQMIEDMMVKGIDGIAVSPIDPTNQSDILNKAAKQTNLITHDSDAPDSDRLAYIGMDNYYAGLDCGKLARKSLPDGGKVAIFIGRLEQHNARRRRQGTIDGLLGRSPDPDRWDPPSKVIEESGYTIVGTYTDQFDRAVGKANAEDVLTRHADVKMMIGLFAYNPPLILEALKQGGQLNKVKVVGFDEDDETLEGIINGTVAGTVVQNPFEYGRQSVLVLAGLKAGKSLEELGFPESNFMNIPSRTIDKDNVIEFRKELYKNMGKPVPN